jgi:hypothetical protein
MNKLGIHIITILTGIMILIAPGCKKKDDTSNPDPVIPPTNTVKIPGKLPDMLHSYEKGTGHGLSANKHMLIGKGLYHSRIFGGANGIGEFPYFDIAELGYDIYKEQHGDPQQEAEYNNINNQLATIESELATLDTDLIALAAELELDVNKLENFEMAQAANTYFGYISDLYSSTSANSLAYFAQTSLAIKKGTSGTTWADLAVFWRQFATNADNNTSGAVASITQLHGLICPAQATMQSGLLAKFAIQVVQQSAGTANQYAHAKTVLGMIENYFTTIVNYQFQAVTVYANVVNVIDPSGSTFKAYLNGTFRQQILDEINAYLQAVDFMTVNLIDFRNTGQFGSDMQYHPIQIAPDTTYLNGLARSRFIAALYRQAVNLKYSIVNGTVVTPNDLTNGTGTPVNTLDISVGSAGNMNSIATALESTYPYTRWGQNGIASPDNNWNSYSFFLDTAVTLTGGKLDLQLMCSDNYHPWRHEEPIGGSVQVLYYNPDKPDQATATASPTATNTMPFGFFAWNWYWGYMRLSMADFSEWTIDIVDAYGLDNAAEFTNSPYGFGVPISNYSLNGMNWATGALTVFPGKDHPSPPFVNKIAIKGNITVAPEQTLGFFADYMVALPCRFTENDGGHTANVHFFSTVTVNQSAIPMPVDFEVYCGVGYTSGDATFSNSDNFDYQNKSQFYSGFSVCTVSSHSINANDQQYVNYVMETGPDEINNYTNGLLDYEFHWCSQYTYNNTYDIFQP